MRDCNQGRFRQQIRFLRHQFLQDDGLPFGDVLSSKTLQQALTAAEVVWNDRIYTPMVTLWVFLGQVLSADHSCRAAVARLIAHRNVSWSPTMFAGNRGLLSGKEASARKVLFNDCMPCWPRIGFTC